MTKLWYLKKDRVYYAHNRVGPVKELTLVVSLTDHDSTYVMIDAGIHGFIDQNFAMRYCGFFDKVHIFTIPNGVQYYENTTEIVTTELRYVGRSDY